MTDQTATADRIAALSDDQAVTTLALVLKRQGLIADPCRSSLASSHSGD
jgi:hypothetical protein